MSDYIQDIRQGNTRVIQIDFGKGVDITGWVFYLTLKKEIDDSIAALQVSTTAGDDALDDVANGLVHLTITSTDSNIDADDYYWAIHVDKGGSPAVINTLLPPIDDWKDQVKIVTAIRL